MKKSILFAVMAAALLSCASSDEPKQPEQESTFWDDVKRDQLNSFVINQLNDIKNPEDLGMDSLMNIAAARIDSYLSAHEGETLPFMDGLVYSYALPPVRSEYSWFNSASPNSVKKWTVEINMLSKTCSEDWDYLKSFKTTRCYVVAPISQHSVTTSSDKYGGRLAIFICCDNPTYTHFD